MNDISSWAVQQQRCWLYLLDSQREIVMFPSGCSGAQCSTTPLGVHCENGGSAAGELLSPGMASCSASPGMAMCGHIAITSRSAFPIQGQTEWPSTRPSAPGACVQLNQISQCCKSDTSSSTCPAPRLPTVMPAVDASNMPS